MCGIKLRIGKEMEEKRPGQGLVKVDIEQQRQINLWKVSRKMLRDVCALKWEKKIKTCWKISKQPPLCFFCQTHEIYYALNGEINHIKLHLVSNVPRSVLVQLFFHKSFWNDLEQWFSPRDLNLERLIIESDDSESLRTLCRWLVHEQNKPLRLKFYDSVNTYWTLF